MLVLSFGVERPEFFSFENAKVLKHSEIRCFGRNITENFCNAKSTNREVEKTPLFMDNYSKKHPNLLSSAFLFSLS